MPNLLPTIGYWVLMDLNFVWQHNVLTTGLGVSGSASVECAPVIPSSVLANSITAHCMPRHTPAGGMKDEKSYIITHSINRDESAKSYIINHSFNSNESAKSFIITHLFNSEESVKFYIITHSPLLKVNKWASKILHYHSLSYGEKPRVRKILHYYGVF